MIDSNSKNMHVPGGASGMNSRTPSGNLEEFARQMIEQMESQDSRHAGNVSFDDAGISAGGVCEMDDNKKGKKEKENKERSMENSDLIDETEASEQEGSQKGTASKSSAKAGVSDCESGAGDEANASDENADCEGTDGELTVEEIKEVAAKEVEEWKDKYLRLHAEWDTYRRRMNEQRANEKALATEKLVNDILPVLDDFERTITYATENGEKGLLDGVCAVQTKLHGVLEKSGLEQLDPAGEPFDALQHQAVATVEDADAYDETVHEVYQKGYKMGTKVLRPAMVRVTTGGPKRPAPKDEEQDE